MQGDWNFRVGPLRFRHRATGVTVILAVVLVLVCCVIAPCLVGAGI